jgi:hypothetical protein
MPPGTRKPLGLNVRIRPAGIARFLTWAATRAAWRFSTGGEAPAVLRAQAPAFAARNGPQVLRRPFGRGPIFYRFFDSNPLLGGRPNRLFKLVGRIGIEPMTNGLKAGPDRYATIRYDTQQQCFQYVNTSPLLLRLALDWDYEAGVVPNLCQRPALLIQSDSL